MPISRINPDGTVKIYNSNTGEIKDVKPEELSKFSPKLFGQYQTIKGASEGLATGMGNITSVSEDFREPVRATISASSETGKTIKGEQSADEQKRDRAKADAERVFTQLEDKYFSANDGKSLAKGRLGGIVANVEARAGANPDLNSYRQLRDSLRPTLARAAGDVGNLALPEQVNAVKEVPTEFNTTAEAYQYFRDARKRFGLPERDIHKIGKGGRPALSSYNE